MLRIKIPSSEYYDEANNEFIEIRGAEITLEHSLVSLSKWESKFHKPFMSNDPKTLEETIEYIKCMTITQNVRPELYSNITQDLMDEINAYIDDRMTATWFNTHNEQNQISRGGVVTAEIIYYWMITLNIPMECQKWHLNRLMTLIKVCMLKNAPAKKMSKEEIYEQQRKLNASRRAKLNSKG